MPEISTIFLNSEKMDETKRVPEHHQLPNLRLESSSTLETVIYPLFYDGFPEEFKVMAETKFKETAQKKRKGLERLTEIIKEENTSKLGTNMLLSILRVCKYDLKKSEVKLKNLIVKQQEILNMAAKLDLEKVERMLDDMGIGFLPYRDKNGALIFYTRPDGINLDNYDTDDMAVVTLCFAMQLLSLPITSVTGFVYLVECKAQSLHIFYPSLKTIRRFLGQFLGLPLRLSKVEVINENCLVRWFVKITRPFLPEKLYNRLEFHGDSYAKLQEYYSPNLLPETFGGNMGPLSNDHYKKRILDFLKELIAESG